MMNNQDKKIEFAADVLGAAAGAGTGAIIAPAAGPVVGAAAGAAVGFGVREAIKNDEIREAVLDRIAEFPFTVARLPLNAVAIFKDALRG